MSDCSAQACLPCRAFFKRSVEQYHEYICFKEKQCQIAYGGRKACKYCRFMVRSEEGQSSIFSCEIASREDRDTDHTNRKDVAILEVSKFAYPRNRAVDEKDDNTEDPEWCLTIIRVPLSYG